ncbi:SAG-related sequence SRS16E [Toxoplasma gondii MAS]|uniref:SAG-related sequence SRS16E n=1 Tax=Toxoplasma gondii MAS TaxID=943118 RepID=A0A086QF72_TOXGO|nr:SAG-related sequence SRS16E [Toxoplasma gondii MAS]
MARTGSMQQRRGGFQTTARMLMAVCVSGVLLLSSGPSSANKLTEGQQNQNSGPGAATQEGPTIEGAVAKCALKTTAAENGSSRAKNTTGLTLSKENLVVSLQCSGEKNAIVPKDQKKVCSAAPNAKVADCKGADTDKQVTLKSLLGTSGDIQWEKTIVSTDNKGEVMTLKIKESELPLFDKAFFVGCEEDKAQTRTSQATECKVNVSVKARPSTVGENNVVTCAYGKDSNPRPLEVELSADNDTLTIDCGTDGSLKPTKYTEEFCVTDNSQLESCTTKKFSEILPTFLPSWWVSDSQNGSAKLTIPESGFPEEQQQFRLGCVPKKTTQSPQANPSVKTEKEEGAQNTDASTSNCSVIVTVKASNFSSLASSIAPTAAVAGGAAALTGFLVGSF